MGASRTKQIKIYTKKCFRIFINEKGWKIFISSAIITGLICLVTSDNMFTTQKDTKNGAFSLICACIWIGIFNSIQSICKERDIIKREHRSGLHISSYVISHMLYELALCAVESIIVTVIIAIKNADNLPSDGIFLPAVLEIAITFFLIIYSSDVLGLMVSSIVKTPNTAMTIMPFVLIIQLVMSGEIFTLEADAAKAISNFTIAKWGQNAICAIANVGKMDVFTYKNKVRVPPEPFDGIDHDLGNLMKCWFLLVLFVLAYGAISVVSLKFVDKDKR